MSPGHPQPRFLAFDEGPFRFEDETVPVVGVLTRGASPVEAVVVDRVTVDGFDATERILAMTQRLPGAGPDRILIDGITLGGMNRVDLDTIARSLGRPVYGVTRRAPDRVAMERAIAAAPHPDRRPPLPEDPPLRIQVAGRALHVQVATPDGDALPAAVVSSLLAPSFSGSGLPEPLRLAHHIATAIVRGTSGTSP